MVGFDLLHHRFADKFFVKPPSLLNVLAHRLDRLRRGSASFAFYCLAVSQLKNILLRIVIFTEFCLI